MTKMIPSYPIFVFLPFIFFAIFSYHALTHDADKRQDGNDLVVHPKVLDDD